MEKKYFYYCSPMIYPVLPKASGITSIRLDLAAIIFNHVPKSITGIEDAIIDLQIELFSNGDNISEEKYKISITNNSFSQRFIEKNYVLDNYGYLQVSLFADKPYFSKIDTEKGYALLVGKDEVITTILPQSKYSEPIIIDNMRSTGTFCLVNPGHYIDSQSNISNSALIVNPYEGDIVATAISDTGKKIKNKIKARSAGVVKLQKIVDERVPTCVLYSGSNRYNAWDIRHSYTKTYEITNIDHLEYYRAVSTYKTKSKLETIKSYLKKYARSLKYELRR